MKIVKIVFCVVFCITFIYANPILVTMLHEFQTSPDSLERIELHQTPEQFSTTVNLGGCQIRTRAGIATINQGVILPAGGYITIDSTNTSGIFSLGDLSDTIALYWSSYLLDRVTYPRSTAIWYSVPTPPYGGSSCLYRTPYSFPWDMINWYIDSTPTFGFVNDNWSSISGRVLNAQGQPVIGNFVQASSLTDISCAYTDSFGNYIIAGLGAGKYWVTVWAHVQVGNYPESVYVGYSQTIPNINISLPISGIEQYLELSPPDNMISVQNPVRKDFKISFVLPYETEVLVKLYDTKGSLLKILVNSKLNGGYHQIGLNMHLVPGVYFLNIDIGKQRLTKKLISVK